MIYGTHDQMEAMILATKIIVFRDGVIELFGSPMELYETPRNMLVAQFIGSPKMNFFRANDLLPESGMHCGDEEVMGVRPEHLKLRSNSEGLVAGRLDLVEQVGESALEYIT